MKHLFLITIVTLLAFSSNGQEVIPLYNGEIPPGSETFSMNETARKDSTGEIITIRNVSMPTLTAVRPVNAMGNGTAIIICPGGGFSGLAWQTEGTPTAKWCAEKGITAFILKYRLVPYPYPEFENLRRQIRDSIISTYVTMAAADGCEAVKYVRNHASEYAIDPAKIGILGYSAGGTVAGSVALTYTRESRPDFVVPVYAAVGAIIGDKVPDDAPPMFLVWATNDPISSGNPGLYEKWRDAKKSVEMHAFYSGGHGFSIINHNKPSDIWPDLFMDWMLNQGFIKQ